MKRKGIITVLLISMLILAGCSKGVDNRLGWEVADFSYQNHKGSETTLKDYKGKVWVANFIFTSCSTVCPPMTANMAKLKEMTEKEDLDVEFVSFSVDPEVDTPKMLKDYGKKFTNDLSNWTFLTGYSQQEIETLAKDSFKILVNKEDGNSQVDHGTYFYLVDQDGKIVRYYRGDSKVPYDEILDHIKTIQ